MDFYQVAKSTYRRARNPLPADRIDTRLESVLLLVAPPSLLVDNTREDLLLRPSSPKISIITGRRELIRSNVRRSSQKRRWGRRGSMRFLTRVAL